MAETKTPTLAFVPGSEQEAEGRRVYVRSIEDTLQSVPESQLQTYIQEEPGEVLTTDGLKKFRLRKDAEGSLVQAGAESLARGVTATLSDAALVKLGVTSADELKARQDALGSGDVVGQGVGFLGSVLLTGGGSAVAQGGARGAALTAARVASTPVRAAIRAGTAVERAAAAALSGRVPASLARVAAKGAGLAAEGAALGTAQAVTESELDPDFTAEAFASTVGLNALLSGSVGVLGTAARGLAGKATPAVLDATAGAGKRAVKALSPILAKTGGVDAAELRALASAEATHRTAQKSLEKVLAPQTKTVSKAVQAFESASKKLTKAGLEVAVRDIKKKVPVKMAAEVAEQAVQVSRSARVAATETGDAAASKAAQAYDQAVAKLKPNNAAGRFNAALKLRNTLSPNENMTGVVSQLDSHLGDERLFGAAAKEFKVGQAAANNVRAAQVDLDGFMSQPDQVRELLTKIRPGSQEGLDQLKKLTSTLDDYVKITSGGRDAKLRQEVQRASQGLHATLEKAAQSVGKANAEAEVSRGVLDGAANKAAGLAERFLPNDTTGRAIRQFIGGAAKNSLPGLAAGAAFGAPGSGALVGRAIGVATNPKGFVNTLNRMHEIAGSLETRHKSIMSKWMQGKDVGGTGTKIAAKLSPQLAKLVKAKNPEQKRVAARDYRRGLIEQTNNPVQTAAKLNESLSPLRQVSPGIADKIATSSMGRLMWLVNNMPALQTTGDPFSAIDEHFQMSDAEVSRFQRVAAVVESPTNILPRIVDGTVTRDEVVALRETAPTYHSFLVRTIAEQIPKSNLPYSRKLTLGTVFETPTTPGQNNTQLYQQLVQAQQQQQPRGLNTRTPTPAAQAQMSPLDAVTQR